MTRVSRNISSYGRRSIESKITSSMHTYKAKSQYFGRASDAQPFLLKKFYEKIMKIHHFKRKFIFLSLLLGASQASFAACDQTLSPGANVASAVSSAATGSTICLNSGNYGSINLNNIARSGYVTIRSASAKGASIAPQLGNTKYVRLESLTISSDVVQNSCSTHVQWVNNDFAGRGLTLTNSGCGNLDTLIDGNSFTNFSVGGGYEGRLSLVYGSGITITNNFFGNGGASDGIQLVGGVSNVNISKNTFSGILESLCGSVHCDAIQLYGAGTGIVIDKNYFTNGDTFIMAPDGSDSVTLTNNVFDGASTSYPGKIQMGSAKNPRFEHNIVINTNAGFNSKTGGTATTNAIVKNNILIGGQFDTWYGGGCSNCTFTRNLFNAASNANGTDNLIGTPTYVDGATPTKYTGFQLTSSSLGYKAATDGNDVGVVFTGTTSATTTTTSLSAPTNLRIN